MSLLSSASGASLWRGYDYYRQKRVLHLNALGNMRFESLVFGSEPYAVTIDLSHLRNSACNCPHANGTRIICKHMVATYFAAFPEEAKRFYEAAMAQEEEAERYEQELAKRTVQYIRRLTKKEAQDKLLEVLELGPEWLWDRFVRDNVE